MKNKIEILDYRHITPQVARTALRLLSDMPVDLISQSNSKLPELILVGRKTKHDGEYDNYSFNLSAQRSVKDLVVNIQDSYRVLDFSHKDLRPFWIDLSYTPSTRRGNSQPVYHFSIHSSIRSALGVVS